MKISAVGAELFRMDRQAEMKLIFAIRSFSNASKNRYMPLFAYTQYLFHFGSTVLLHTVLISLWLHCFASHSDRKTL